MRKKPGMVLAVFSAKILTGRALRRATRMRSSILIEGARPTAGEDRDHSALCNAEASYEEELLL